MTSIGVIRAIMNSSKRTWLSRPLPFISRWGRFKKNNTLWFETKSRRALALACVIVIVNVNVGNLLSLSLTLSLVRLLNESSSLLIACAINLWWNHDAKVLQKTHDWSFFPIPETSVPWIRVKAECNAKICIVLSIAEAHPRIAVCRTAKRAFGFLPKAKACLREQDTEFIKPKCNRSCGLRVALSELKLPPRRGATRNPQLTSIFLLHASAYARLL